MKSIFFYETDIGRIGIAEDGNAITDLYLKSESVPQDITIKETAFLKEAGRQLEDYFRGRRRTFELPLAPCGTEFQKKVWKALTEIPYGETWSYKRVAEHINNPKASRAVGMANNKNPIALFIPCHRVIGANGKLVGYAGGLKTKEYLLKLEKQNADS